MLICISLYLLNICFTSYILSHNIFIYIDNIFYSYVPSHKSICNFFHNIQIHHKRGIGVWYIIQYYGSNVIILQQ